LTKETNGLDARHYKDFKQMLENANNGQLKVMLELLKTELRLSDTAKSEGFED